MLDRILTAPLAGLVMLVMVMLPCFLVERARPATRCPLSGVLFNIAYSVPATLLQAATATLVGGAAVAAINLAGGGLVVLPSSGWQLIPAVAAYTFVMDCGEYFFHRAQHRSAILWAMHSFHHSDRAMNVSTTTRHFWAEQALKTVTVYLAAGMVFKANAQVIAWYGLIMLSNVFFHMNIRFGFGRGWFLLNSPQYHRIHHSFRPEHLDKNFAALFPLFDVIFGTAYRMRPGEFPPTGLSDQDSPFGLVEALIWPFRRFSRQISGPMPHQDTRIGSDAGAR